MHGLASALVIVLQFERRHRLETERLALERKLALGRRMETVGALASGVAHNLNNILNAIGGFGERAALHVPSDGVAADSLREIAQAVDRAGSLVGDILRFGRRVEGPPEPVDLNLLIAETAKLMAASLPRGIALDLQAANEAVRVAGEFGQLQQVLLNLCNNAANAMPEGGAIIWRSALRLLDDPVRLSHGVLRRGRYATLAVEDGGCGIHSDVIPHLFDAFYTTRTGGTGLGLSTAREIVRRHGGTIDVNSMTGAGSRFTIWLPLNEDYASSEADARRGTGETVLMLNTDAKRLSDDEELLAALGYEPCGIGDLSDLPLIRVGIDAVLGRRVRSPRCGRSRGSRSRRRHRRAAARRRPATGGRPRDTALSAAAG